MFSSSKWHLTASRAMAFRSFQSSPWGRRKGSVQLFMIFGRPDGNVSVHFPLWPRNWGCHTRVTIVLGFSKALERDRDFCSASGWAVKQSFGRGFIPPLKSSGGPSSQRTFSCSSKLDRVSILYGSAIVCPMPEGSPSQNQTGEECLLVKAES